MDNMFEIFLIVMGVIALVVLLGSFFTVEQQSVAIVERFGRFVRACSSGLHMKIPLVEKVRGRASLRVMQLDVRVETKTLDNVFLTIITAVQYRILPSKTYEAFYTLDNAEEQIQAYVFDVVRAKVPQINLDDVFSKKDEIADSVRLELSEVMNDFGYDILKALVTDIDPDAKVKSAMNEINEAQRLRVAARERGEAEKILKVKQAEGEAESKILQGQGVAGQRRAIVEGLQTSLSDFQKSVQDAKTMDVMTLILMTQYFDMLKDMSMHSKMSTILLPHSPAGLGDLYQQIRETIITSDQITNSLRDEA